VLSRSNDRLTKRRLAVSEICITRPPAQPCLRNPNQTLWTAPRLGMWLNSLRPQSRRLRGEFAMTYCKSLISVLVILCLLPIATLGQTAPTAQN